MLKRRKKESKSKTKENSEAGEWSPCTRFQLIDLLWCDDPVPSTTQIPAFLYIPTLVTKESNFNSLYSSRRLGDFSL